MPISKYHEELERKSIGSPDPNLLTELKQKLNAGEDLCKIASDLNLLTDPKEKEHLQRDWYNKGSSPGWWPEHNTDGIVRKAYLELIELITAQPRPVRTVWVAGTGVFAIVLDATPQLITRIVMTPRVPTSTDEMVGTGMCVVYQDAGGIRVSKEKPLKV